MASPRTHGSHPGRWKTDARSQSQTRTCRSGAHRTGRSASIDGRVRGRLRPARLVGSRHTERRICAARDCKQPTALVPHGHVSKPAFRGGRMPPVGTRLGGAPLLSNGPCAWLSDVDPLRDSYLLEIELEEWVVVDGPRSSRRRCFWRPPLAPGPWSRCQTPRVRKARIQNSPSAPPGRAWITQRGLAEGPRPWVTSWGWRQTAVRQRVLGRRVEPRAAVSSNGREEADGEARRTPGQGLAAVQRDDAWPKSCGDGHEYGCVGFEVRPGSPPRQSARPCSCHARAPSESSIRAVCRCPSRSLSGPCAAPCGPEPVKPGETTCHADLMSASGVGSLIQATVGSVGGVGRRCPNRAGLAA